MKKGKKKILILFNPSSGRGKALHKKAELLELLHEHQIKFELHQTTSEQDLRQQIVLRHHEFDCFVAAGGDSTLAIIIEELHKHKIALPIAIIPVGTSDDIARQWGMISMVEAVQALAQFETKHVDLVIAEDHKGKRLVGVAGQINIGLGAVVNDWMARLYRFNMIAKLPQAVVGFWVIFSLTLFKRLSLKVELTHKDSTKGSKNKTEVLECSAIIFTSICYWVKGLLFSPKSRCDDGLIEAVVVHKVGFFSVLKLFISSKKGNHIHLPFVKILQAKEFFLKNLDTKKTMLLQADGEIVCEKEKKLNAHKVHIYVQKQAVEAVFKKK